MKDNDEEFDDDHYDEPDELDEYEEAMGNCSWDGIAGHSCMAIGSEQCDWECPFSGQMWHGLHQCRDSKGRFAKKQKQEANGG